MSSKLKQQESNDGILINARIRISTNVAYFSRSHLQGCRLKLIRKQINSIDDNQFDYSMTGRAYVQPDTLLAYLVEDGEFAGERFAVYWLVRVDPNEKIQTIGFDPHKYLKGPFEILAYAADDQAERLREWWLEWAPKNGGQTASIARWLGSQIKQGYEMPSAYPNANDVLQNTPTFDPITGWKFENVTPAQMYWFGKWFE